MNKFEIVDEVGFKENYKYLNRVIKRTLKHEKVKNAIFNIIFVDDEKIQEINKNYRNVDRITDVISFALEDNKKIRFDKLRILGDIYICIPQMLRQANNYNHSVKRELSFLTVHGLLHLLGYDHIDKDDEKKMFELQELILNEENITR